jgi:hypothetical protein
MGGLQLKMPWVKLLKKNYYRFKLAMCLDTYANVDDLVRDMHYKTATTVHRD